ncbi:hypothetical protein Q1695_000522 [Nippostrongylus brasiliensis]|nr:hypothetical protein Q1695_000522 [Nippostrongylus brasiliensis]
MFPRSSAIRNLAVALERLSVKFYDDRHQTENAICSLVLQEGIPRKFARNVWKWKNIATSANLPANRPAMYDDDVM